MNMEISFRYASWGKDELDSLQKRLDSLEMTGGLVQKGRRIQLIDLQRFVLRRQSNIPMRGIFTHTVRCYLKTNEESAWRDIPDLRLSFIRRYLYGHSIKESIAILSFYLNLIMRNNISLI